MGEIKALDKLREWARIATTTDDPIWGIIGEIEREIDYLIDDMGMTSVDGYEAPFSTPDALHMVLGTAADFFDTPEDAVRYLQGETSMLLPLDADGVPIRVGDMVSLDGGKPFEVGGVRDTRSQWHVFPYDLQRWYAPLDLHHVKPRTLEDVVIDAIKYGHGIYPPAHCYDEKVAELCAEIRKLLGGDAE